jgi:N6-adenosine-specific RNA methylase IME4
MKIHRIAELFPLLPDDELRILSDDIKANGLQQAIVMQGDTLLDGRNRLAACKLAGVNPKSRQYEGKDAEAFIISSNLHRRHLSESQRGMVAHKLANMPLGGGVYRCANLHTEKQISLEQAADLLNVSRRLAADARLVAREAPEAVAQIEAGKKTIYQVKRDIKREKQDEEIKEAQKKPKKAQAAGPYDLILADPPWKYDFEEAQNRAVENVYPTAAVEEICKHKPDSKPNSILFLWATAPKLLEALKVMEAWGYQYKTHAVWNKEKIGMGYWFRGQHEVLLVGTKGKPGATPESERVSSVFQEARKGHSEKPECVYKWIERAFPALSKLEMYCRGEPRKGWAGHGNECK